MLPAPTASDNTVIWTARPSQWLNVPTFFVVAMAVPLSVVGLPWPFSMVGLVFVLPALWSYLVVRCTRYTLTARHLRIEFGVLTRHTEEVELYRIEDTGLSAPFFLRLMGLGNLYVLGSDRSTPRINLQALTDTESKRQQLRDQVEAARVAKGVRVIE
ncbi:PH domain-containing protein [Alloalcanivorax xenomutans]|uniref:PH domain-containing protein n=1 Tax=Alloalcanivorax xenomutans TaxID=1094342 RepID=A0A9Q3ZID0_9GAMM|nr:PH domain-containing protein [Alloalcanivorax xenomutans]MCE7510992.1 PH domain-containing protein [Alloalcanivorax xenomutans]